MDRIIENLQRNLEKDPENTILLEQYERQMRRLGAIKVISRTKDLPGGIKQKITIKTEIHTPEEKHRDFKEDYYWNWWLSKGENHREEDGVWKRDFSERCAMLLPEEISKVEAVEVDALEKQEEKIHFDETYEPYKKVLDKRHQEVAEHYSNLMIQAYQGGSQVLSDSYGWYVPVPFTAFYDYEVNPPALFNELYSEGLDVSFVTTAENPDRVLIYFNTPIYGNTEFTRLNQAIRAHSPRSYPGEIIRSDGNFGEGNFNRGAEGTVGNTSSD